MESYRTKRAGIARDRVHLGVAVVGDWKEIPPALDAAPERNAGARQSGEQALKMAGVELEDVDIRELYDCYTYSVGTLPNGRRWQAGATQLRALAYAVKYQAPALFGTSRRRALWRPTVAPPAQRGEARQRPRS